MIEAVNAVAVSVTPPVARPAASGLDIDRFREAFAAVPVATDAASVASASAPIDASVPAARMAAVNGEPVAVVSGKPAAPTSLGDAILNGLKSASADINRNWSEVASTVSKPMLTTSEMLRIQVTLIQTSVQYELLGKGISRSTQNLDQILKTQ